MAEAKSLTVGKFTYMVMPAPAEVGLRCAMRLAKLAAPALRMGTGKLILAEILASDLLIENVELLAASFAPRTQVTEAGRDNWSQSLDKLYSEHFAGNYGALLKWLAFAVQVNLSSFFDGLPELLASADQALAAEFGSKSPTAASTSG